MVFWPKSVQCRIDKLCMQVKINLIMLRWILYLHPSFTALLLALKIEYYFGAEITAKLL